jgi:hypothetical protein
MNEALKEEKAKRSRGKGMTSIKRVCGERARGEN